MLPHASSLASPASSAAARGASAAAAAPRAAAVNKDSHGEINTYGKYIRGNPLCIGQFPWSRIPKSNYISRNRITELRWYKFVPGAWLQRRRHAVAHRRRDPHPHRKQQPRRTRAARQLDLGSGPPGLLLHLFGQTLANPADHGRVKIMVVNTNSDKGFHWFVVACFIDP